MSYPNFPGVGIPTFLRSPLRDGEEAVDADIAVLGIPTDEGSPYKPGTRFGPRAIREHSLRFCAGGEGFFDPHTGKSYLVEAQRNKRIVDLGDAPILPTNVAETFTCITGSVRKILDAGAFPVLLGGDHAIPYPIVRAYDRPLHVFQFDAHLDYEPFSHGLEMTNGHAFRHIARMPHVQSLTQIGIRSIRNPQSTFDESIADGNRVVTMEEFASGDAGTVVGDVPAGSPCYVTIDIDALDMSLVPGCMSAEPNGMSYAQLRDALAILAERMQIVGFDLCEVNPMLDVATGVTSYLATYTILEFLGRICDRPGWNQPSDSRTAEHELSAST
jgi:agmatinase